MSASTRVPPAEINGITGTVIKVASKRMFGRVPDSIGVMWHSRPALFTGMKSGRRASKWKNIDPDLRSYAHMAVSSMIGCSFCLDFGYFTARNEGLDLVKAREVPRWRESDAFTPLERDVMEFAEAMSQTPVAVTDELFAALLDRLGPAGMVELCAWVGLVNSMTRTNIALGIESEGFAEACGLPPLAEPTRAPRQSGSAVA